MSLKTLLQKIGEDIASIFKKTVAELDTVILPAAVAVTNALKTIVDGDAGDILGRLVGAAGPGIEDTIRTTLTKVVPQLQLAQQFLGSSDDPAVILGNVVKLVGNSPAVTKTSFYIEFSGLVAQDLADGKLTTSEAVQLAQYYYKNVPTASASQVKSDPVQTSAPVDSQAGPQPAA